jgi:hypothetical protein
MEEDSLVPQKFFSLRTLHPVLEYFKKDVQLKYLDIEITRTDEIGAPIDSLKRVVLNKIYSINTTFCSF